jgi:hypothetical protein
MIAMFTLVLVSWISAALGFFCAAALAAGGRADDEERRRRADQ